MRNGGPRDFTRRYPNHDPAVVAEIVAAGGKAIANQTAKKFTPLAGDVGAKVSCRAAVTYSGALNQLAAISKPVQIKR